MSKLLEELQRAPQTLPFVFELYRFDPQEGLEEMLDERVAQGDIIIRWDGTLEKRTFTDLLITSIFQHYRQEAPELREVIQSGLLSALKLGMFGGGFFASGGTALLLPVLGAFITLGELNSRLDRDESDMKKEAALEALVRFRSELKDMRNAETFILAAVRLLFLVSQEKPIIVQAMNPERLTALDLQLIRTYFSLFKDRSSRLQFGQYIGNRQTFNASLEAQSRLLILLDWKGEQPSEWTGFTSGDIRSSLKEFRWFLRRYALCDDLHGDYYPAIVGEHAFVGRWEHVASVKKDFMTDVTRNKAVVRKIKGNSGMGKTTLANRIHEEILSGIRSCGLMYMNTAFSGDQTAFRQGLTEIRTCVDRLALEVDPGLKDKWKRMVSSLQEKEAVQWLKSSFQWVSDTHSLLSPLLKVVTPTVANYQTVLDSFSAAKDAYEFIASGREIAGVRSSIVNETETSHDMRSIIAEMVIKFIRLGDLCAKENRSVLWVIDDIQWMDEESASFFHALIKHPGFADLPVMLLFLERQADIESRLSSGAATSLDQLRAMTTEHEIALEGFGLPEVADLIRESVVGPDPLVSVTAQTLLDWFGEGDTVKVEPLFIVETLNLMADEQSGESVFSYEQVSKTWTWRHDSTADVKTAILKQLSLWSSRVTDNPNHAFFSPTVSAVMEERVYRIERHFGEEAVCLLQAGSFIGEPFVDRVVSRYLEVYNMKKNEGASHLTDIEYNYQIIRRFIEETATSDLAAYLFGHSLYRQYFCEQWVRRDGNNANAHDQVFAVLNEFLTDQVHQINQSWRYILLQQAIYHGENCQDPASRRPLFEHMAELIKVENSRFHYSAVVALGEKAECLAHALFGEDEESVMASINLAAYYKLGGRLAECIAKLEEVNRRLVNGAKAIDPEIYIYLFNNLGIYYREIRDYDRAVFYFTKVFDIIKDDFHYKYPRIAVFINNLANALKFQASRDGFRSLFEDAKAMFESGIELVTSVPSLADRQYQGDVALISNFAHLYKLYSRFEEAEDQPSQAALYLTEAERKFLEAKQILEDRKETGSILYLDVLNNLIDLYLNANRDEECDPLLRQAIKVGKMIGVNQPYYGETLYHQGNYLLRHFTEENDLVRAEKLYRESIAIISQTRGPYDESVGLCLTKLLNLSSKLKQGDPKGMNVLLELIDYQKGKFGPDHILTITSLAAYTKLHMESRRDRLPIWDDLMKVRDPIMVSVFIILAAYCHHTHTKSEAAMVMERVRDMLQRVDDQKMALRESVDHFYNGRLDPRFYDNLAHIYQLAGDDKLADKWRLERKRATEPSSTRQTLPKVGMNQPCPCGSGKKYKLCHGRNQKRWS